MKKNRMREWELRAPPIDSHALFSSSTPTELCGDVRLKVFVYESVFNATQFFNKHDTCRAINIVVMLLQFTIGHYFHSTTSRKLHYFPITQTKQLCFRLWNQHKSPYICICQTEEQTPFRKEAEFWAALRFVSGSGHFDLSLCYAFQITCFAQYWKPIIGYFYASGLAIQTVDSLDFICFVGCPHFTFVNNLWIELSLSYHPTVHG